MNKKNVRVIKRGEKISAILEAVKEGVVDIATLFDVFIEAGYGASYGKIEYIYNKRLSEQERKKYIRKEKIKYAKFIWYLKKSNLIEETNDKKIQITKKGKERYLSLKKRGKYSIKSYKMEGENNNIIIVFDIPEKEKRKRAWLRDVLKEMEFKLIQRSVWLGKGRLPKEFVDDIRTLNLSSYIHIFQVKKVGTLEDELTD